MLKAKDIMTENLVYVKTKSPVKDALRLFSKHNVTGIPVVEGDMSLVGIISEMDVLRLFHTFKDEKNRPVDDFMTQPAVHFEQEESLLDICDFLINSN